MKQFILFFTFIVGLSSCSGTYTTYIDDLSLAMKSQADVNLTFDEVRQYKQDLLYVRYGEQAVIAMVLGFLEAGQHKWLSANNAMLVIEQGRIIRTLGMADNLLALTNLQNDPLKQSFKIQEPQSWTRVADWEHGGYSYEISSTFEVIGTETLNYFGHQLITYHVREHVNYNSRSNSILDDTHFINDYWFDEKTNQMIKSNQQLIPSSDVLSMVYISRIARLVEAEKERVK